MPMLREDIERTLSGYAQRFPEDHRTIAELRALQRERAEITSRKEFRGHVTCGAIVINEAGRLLMIQHRSLGKWLFPGGHLELDDLSLRGAALREAAEETGLSTSNLSAPANEFATLPVQVDCHLIPPNPSKAEPEHRHFDFRFVFEGEPDQFAPQLDEVSGCAWMAADYAPPEIRMRLVELRLI
jgi:8-oxo-dGTP pyrophosphatase MutT (NUDIX family)